MLERRFYQEEKADKNLRYVFIGGDNAYGTKLEVVMWS